MEQLKHIKFVSEKLFNVIEPTTLLNNRVFMHVINKLKLFTNNKRRVFLTGGFLCFLLNLSNSYNDIDFFFEGDVHPGDFELWKSRTVNNKYNEDRFKCVYFKEDGILYNFIYLKDFSFLTTMEQFITSILNSFDMDFCKNAIYLEPYHNGFNYYLIRFNFCDMWVRDNLNINSRMDKYLNRLNNFDLYIGNPQKLSLLSLLEVSKTQEKEANKTLVHKKNNEVNTQREKSCPIHKKHEINIQREKSCSIHKDHTHTHFVIKIRKALNSSIIKVNSILYANFIQPSTHETDLKHFITPNEIIDLGTDLKKWFNENIVDKLTVKLEDFQERDSGWSLLEIAGLKININKFCPISAGAFVELPQFIKNKKAVLNIKNNDKYCFLWCIVASLFPNAGNPSRTSSYPDFRSVLNYEGIDFPIKFKDIKKFENLNNLSINVYCVENDTVLPVVLSKRKTPSYINLLALSTNANPRENILKFTQYHTKQIVPFVVYADIECILKPCNFDLNKNSFNVHKHIPYSVSYYLKCTYDDSLSKFKLYRGDDCIIWLVSEFKEIAMKFKNIPEKQIDPLTNFEKELFKNATHCHICEETFKPNEEKVKDHFHLASGCNDINSEKTNYRGPAHSLCNLQFKRIKTIPIIFHNLSNYDSHFLIKELLNQYEGHLSILPSTKEKYISFSKFVKEANIYLRFIDSFRFLPESLDTLSSQLENSEKIITKAHCQNEDEFAILCNKGIFPYEYINSWDKLNEEKLPERNCFFSSLNDSHITDKEYERALKVWQGFNIKNLGDYSDLYLKTDVL
ncbi:unnamed protein product [Brassicogethes aeneus]|uniref:DNA-directed DNA polymerase n=1 Tax=Brassicogethes aeneus TaxID=1431903 RepID=A0A9P0FQ02_BRAAE|nr:unnamed protein product [Brassicogethes aeneus]